MKAQDLRQTIEQLSDNERKLLTLKVKEYLNNTPRASNSENQKKIVAYVKTNNSLLNENLKTYLKSKLPEYMIPVSIYKVENMPILPNGKINKKVLSKLKDSVFEQNTDQTQIIKPNSEIERKLVEIWETVLGFAPISTHDNFFEIGGDSILSIQIISKARQAGIELKANQIFENQTIAELALFSNKAVSEDVMENNIEGEVELTPIQHWFFDTHKAEPHFWNQIAEVKNISSDINSKEIETIATKLVLHHDALRSSFTKKNMVWKAYILNPESIKPFDEINLELVEDKHAQDVEIEKAIETIQQNFNLSEGSLFKIIYFNCGETQKDKVYIIAHHLVIDFISWNIIFQDLQLALEQIADNIKITFGKKTDSIKKWGEYLNTLINSGKVLNELAFWSSQKNDTIPFPVDFENIANVYKENSISNHTSIIDEKDTATLLFKANELYNTKIEDLLITSLLKTICEWANMEHFCLGLERQGRALDDDTIDILNTVGWFTAYFPITLKNNNSDDIGEKIKSVKEQLNAIPNNGIGYGILKYVSNENKTDLDINPKVVFNYLGKTNDSFDHSNLDFQFLHNATRSELSERTYQIEINALVKNGQLNINWSYTNDLYKETTFLKLASAYETNLNELIAYCNQKENGGYTPSDFPESGLNQEDLDNLIDLF